jgi:hypothetical protein
MKSATSCLLSNLRSPLYRILGLAAPRAHLHDPSRKRSKRLAIQARPISLNYLGEVLHVLNGCVYIWKISPPHWFIFCISSRVRPASHLAG